MAADPGAGNLHPHDGPDYDASDLGLDDLMAGTVDPQLIRVDRLHYQRPLFPPKVLSLMKTPDVLTTHRVLIGVRASGAYFVADGQHHAMAALMCAVPAIPAQLFASDGWEHEAEVQGRFNAFMAAQNADVPDSKDDDDV